MLRPIGSPGEEGHIHVDLKREEECTERIGGASKSSGTERGQSALESTLHAADSVDAVRERIRGAASAPCSRRIQAG
jgi:hypothetical protein